MASSSSKTSIARPRASIRDGGNADTGLHPARCMTYRVQSFAAPLWRMIHPARQREPFSGEGARLHGGRWNLKGWPALYLATDHATAVAEYYQSYPKPGVLAPYALQAEAIADLTDGSGAPADRRVAEALTADWKTITRIDGQVPPSWSIAQELIAAGAEGALVPSVQNRGAANLVLWRWHDAGAAGEGARLALLDPEAALTGR